MIGMVLPQGMWAETFFPNENVTIDITDGVVTIDCKKAGQLEQVNLNSGNPSLGSRIASCSTIKFKGYFCGSDLNKLKGNNNNQDCCKQSTVDMSEAHFVEYSGDANSHTNNYSYMSFKNWGSNVTTAITSNNADNNISNDIFQNCKSLTNVEFLSGTVKGFNDHKAQDGYSTGLSVTIGKNVTSIADAAFQRCDVLSSVTFKKDYSGGETPVNLTIGQEAFESCSNLSAIEFPNRVTSIGNSAFKKAGTSVDNFAVSFERRTVSEGASVDYDVDLTIGNSAFDNCTTIQTLSLPIRLKTMGNGAFAHTSGLTTIEIREDVEDARLTTIPHNAFLESGITSIKIPRSVTLIEGGPEGGAFQSCYNLETITFQESHQNPQPDLLIKTGAFAGGTESLYKLKHVYVDIDPTKRKLICEYDAFNFTSMVGQTDVTSEQMATLHFSEAYWDYYAGDWKKGVTFTQTALNSFKDGCDPTKDALNGESMNDGTKKGTNEQVRNNAGRIPDMSPGNGWHQFARTDTGIDIIVEKGKYFRTYSTDVAQVRPEWMHIYRITAFSDGFDKNNPNFNDPNSREQADAAEKKATAVEITAENTGGYSLIPAKTGMIRVDIVKEDALYYFMEWSNTNQSYSTDWEYRYNEDLKTANNQKLNFMYPTGEEDRVIGPVERGDDGKIKYRIFGLLKNPIEGTNRLAGQFSRAKNPTTLAKNRAYLKLPAALFNWTNESTGSSQNATDDATPSQYGKISLFFDDFFEEMNGGITTEIKEAIEAEMYKNDSFYTIQGVKVAKPTAKGVYIHNGKKIFIK